jgi:long-chain fatty acid transport protein
MPSIAFATNGYFSHGFGTKSKGLAGAAVALPQDAMVAATNPAGMVHVGSRWDVGLAAFNPNRGYTANDDAQPGSASIPAGEFESSNDFFFIPHFGINWMLDDVSSVGLSIGGNGGMNTEYRTETFRNFAPGQPAPIPSHVAYWRRPHSAVCGFHLCKENLGTAFLRDHSDLCRATH